MEKGNEIVEFNLPPAPRGVCFDRQDFIKSNFSLESFIEEHQNGVSLETMRDDLGSYLKVLRLAMIELINKDYANFVNLSATLIGFDKSIEKINEPLVQLEDEVKDVKQHLEDAMKELSMWLNQRHSLQKKKQLLRHYSHSIKCLSTLEKIMTNISDKSKVEKIVIIDRATMQYVQLKYTISKCEPLLKSEQNSQYDTIGEILIQTTNELLFQFWNDGDEDKLLATLTSLAMLDRVPETEALIRKQAIGPLLQDVINESSLQKNKNFRVLYDTIINLLDTKLKVLYKVMQHSKLSFLSRKYNFLVNCFWCEIESRLEVNLTSIFAPGNPIIFYQRYNESMQFVRRLEGYCSDPDIEKPIQQTMEYKSFCKRWNLPVYFQIRFQEIAGGFECTLGPTPSYDSSDDEFLIRETRNCWTALQQCWSEGIFIEALGHKFWKLTLQLLQRYTSWCCQLCKQQGSINSENTNLNKSLINHSINLYLDSQSLLKKLPQFLQSIQHKMPSNTKEILAKSLNPAKENLNNIRIQVRECIVNELYSSYNVYLKQVSDIPRLYRKTNRSLPSKPCSYIEAITKSIQEFCNETCKKLDEKFIVELFEGLFNTMTVAYFKYVEDVLTSVQRTEESLRRLKQIREKSLQATSETVGITDDDKIRLQLNIDVTAYGKIVSSRSVDVNRVHKLIELNNMVKDAVKNIDIK